MIQPRTSLGKSDVSWLYTHPRVYGEAFLQQMTPGPSVPPSGAVGKKGEAEEGARWIVEVKKDPIQLN